MKTKKIIFFGILFVFFITILPTTLADENELVITVQYPNEVGKGTASGVCVELPFTVTVSKNDSSPAVNALVTLQGDSTEYYTDGNGQVLLVAPSTCGTYIITVSFEEFMDGTATVRVLCKEEDICKTGGSLYIFFICLAFWVIIVLVGVLIVIAVILKYKR